MSIHSLPTLATVLLSLVLGLFVLARDNRSKLNRTFATWCFLTAYWQACWTILFNIDDVKIAEKIARLGYSGIIFIPIVFFHFVVEFAKTKSWKPFVFFSYGLGAVFVIATWSGSIFVAGTYKYAWGYYPRAGWLHGTYLVALLVLLFSGLVLLMKVKHQSQNQPLKLNQANYIFVSTIIYSLAGIDFLANYGFGYYPSGLIFTNIHACVIAYAIVQYRLLDVGEAIKRSVIYALVLLALLIPCYVALIEGQVYAFGVVSYSFSFLTLLLLTAVAFLFPKFRFMTEEALERALFKRKTDYRETLLRFSRDMVSMVEITSLSENLVRTVGKALGIPNVSIFLLDESKGNFRPEASTSSLSELENTTLFQDDKLVQRLRHHREAVVKEELEISRDGVESLQTIAIMNRLGVQISLPILSKNKLIGVLNLGQKEVNEIYSSEDLELLSTLANQAAIAIENARLYQNLKKSQDTLRRADRLSSLGLLTAGLAHEIRNPLVAIRTFTQLLPERYEDADFRNGFQSLALKEVDRICGLITDLLSFARPSRPNVAQEDMNNVIDGIARILDTQAKEKSVELIRDFAPNLPKVWIDREQMKQVFMNLIFNGIQAMNDGGTITISTRLFTPDVIEQSPSFVQVEVRDTGIGIPNENLEHIFDPFFTSKDEGSGLGLSISHQIVQEHGGYVTVESKLGKGTSFLVNIPTGKPVRAVTERNLHVHEANLSH